MRREPADKRRMKLRLTVLAITLSALTLFASPALAQNDAVVEIGVNFWKPSPDIILSTEGLDEFDLDTVDFVDVFGIEDKWFPDFHVTAGRSHKFRFSYVQPKYEADTTLNQTIVFRGQTFNINVPATADIKWTIIKVGYEWDFVSMDRGFFGAVVDLKWNTIEASIDSPALTSAAATDTSAPVPTFGVAGRGWLHDMVSIGGEFTGFKFNRDDMEANWWDFDINGAVHVGRNFSVQGGYKSILVDFDIEEDQGDLKLKGPYIGVNARF
jgi:hypothetical protein